MGQAVVEGRRPTKPQSTERVRLGGGGVRVCGVEASNARVVTMQRRKTDYTHIHTHARKGETRGDGVTGWETRELVEGGGVYGPTRGI